MVLAVRWRIVILISAYCVFGFTKVFALPDPTQFFEFLPSNNRVCYIPLQGEPTRQGILIGKIRKDGQIKLLGTLVDRLKKLKKLRAVRRIRAKREKTLLLTCLNQRPPGEPPPPPKDARCDNLPVIDTAKGSPDFGMKVESVIADNDDLKVTTSGAEYIISRNKIEMWRRVDPKTNKIGPRKVSELNFGSDIGTVGFCSRDANFARLISDGLVFDFYADSFFIVTALKDSIYTHVNLISDPPWNKGSGLDRMWTDGYGGSLHAKIGGAPNVAFTDPNSSTFALKENDLMGHMVFPPRLFNFEGLYGPTSRPFVEFIYSEQDFLNLMNPNTAKNYADEGFGVLMLWDFHYVDTGDRPTLNLHPDIQPYPIRSYKIKPELETLFRNFIESAHARGYKVITYLSYPAGPRWNYPEGHVLAGRHQDIETTLKWMKKFQAEYELDGWYFDNADTGDLLSDYNFMRQVRSDVGPNGIIYHHDSVDVWGAYSGLRAVMVNSYVDYTLTGETGPSAKINDPLDSYLRFFTAGYGISQTYAAHKRTSLMVAAISEEELDRALAQNLHGCQRNRTYTWSSYFKPFYDREKLSFIQGAMNFDVQWPPDQNPGWFKRPEGITIENLSGTSVRIRWATSLPTDSSITYTSNGVWWISDNGPDGPDGIEGNDELVTNHVVTLSYLKANTPYQFKIRSGNQAPLMEEISLGQMGSFQTGSADSDGDTLIDDWELQYFGNLTHTKIGDADHDALYEFQEQAIGTNPTLVDSDFDGISDPQEVSDGSDPLDWNDPPRSCNNDGICQNGTSGETVQTCPNDCKPGLLANYSFSQPNAWDRSRFGYDGVPRGVSWSNGSYYFPLSIGGHIELPPALSQLENYFGSYGTSTIAAWVKPNKIDRFNQLATGVGGFGYVSIGSPQHPGAIKVMVRTTDNINDWPTSSGTIEPNVWSHLAFVLKGGIGSEFYINGKLDSIALDPKVILYQYDPNPSLGRGDVTSNFSGNIDEVSIWQRPLSPAEICTLAGKTWSGSVCN